MKTSIHIKIATLILFGIFLNGTLQAESDKNNRYNKIPATKLTDSIMSIVAANVNLLFSHGVVTDSRWANSIEEQMFETDYLDTESDVSIESWMLDSNYFEEESSELESWMFNEDRLSEKENDSTLETWMFDCGYLVIK